MKCCFYYIMCFIQDFTINPCVFKITSESEINNIEVFVFILIPNEEAVDVSIVGDMGRDPGDFHTVRLNMAKAQISGGWYSYTKKE